MKAPYKQEFDLPTGQRITSLVMDKEEFDRFVDDAATIKFSSGASMNPEMVRHTKEIGWFALGRGVRTQFLFDRYGITTPTLGAIVRGLGLDLFERLTGEKLKLTR